MQSKHFLRWRIYEFIKMLSDLKTNAMRIVLLKLVVLFLSVIYLSSCGFTNQNSIRDFIPGVYARQFEGEFSKGSDTLMIERFSGPTYVIARNVSYRRMEDGKLKTAERKLTRLTAVYSETQEVLVENKKGLIISFDPSRNMLMFGRSVYKKIR
jgi:hypothetical protein